MLHYLGKGSGKNDYGAMTESINKEKYYSVKESCRCYFKCNTEHWRHIGKGAGAEGNTKNKAQDKTSQQTFFPECGLT